jgi:acyl-CoA synthetase (AMP-forming)/AMP-acid ligase II
MLVPTMLARIVAEVHGDEAGTPTLRSLAYGGARMPRPVLERALRIFPETGFVNAYGLTETASSVAVLGPEDHRQALTSDDPAIQDRLGSVGRALPGIEFQIRADDGNPAGPGETGLVFVRGEQISGEYNGQSALDARALDAGGWFATRDRGRLDAEGYLFIEGRSDDTIIRGGENIAPAELEDVLIEHAQVHDVAVVGVDDPQWGQAIVAVVVPAAGADPDPEELREHVRKSLRGSRTPDRVVFRDELPTNATGKVLRREIVDELRAAPAEQ